MNIKKLQKKFSILKKKIDPRITEKEKKSERRKGMVKGFALGSVVAGITALLLSPDTGEKNRERAKKELEKAKDILETSIVGGKKKLVEVYEGTKEVIKDKKDALIEKLDSDYDIDILEDDFELEADFEIEDELEISEEDSGE